MSQPHTLTVTEFGFEPVEIVDMGDHLILLQRDETGEANSIVLGPQAMEELWLITQARRGARG